jgi:hypothetical protein
MSFIHRTVLLPRLYRGLPAPLLLGLLAACDIAQPAPRALASDAPAAPADEVDAEFDPWSEWGGPRLDAGERAPFTAGEYDVVVLSEELPPRSLARVHAALSRTPGAVLFSVQERDEVQFVAAVPHVDGAALSERVWELVDLAAPGEPSRASCNVLYRLPGWFGAELNVCASGSSPKSYSNLGSYGFNNIASSYYIYTQSFGFLELFNYTGLSGKLTELDWDDWNFDDSFDDKASSMRYHFWN